MTTVADLITRIQYRLFPGGETISTSTTPTQAEIIEWINEANEWITGVLAEERAGIGRTLGTITTVDGTASYATLSTMYAPTDLVDKNGNTVNGWVLKTNSRNPIKLTTEGSSIDYSPASTAEGEPEMFYVDGSNNVVFLPTPDAVYTVKIPYYPMPTALTTTGATVPFLGLFDGLLVQAVVIRAQNRDEYDISNELKWFSFLTEKARRVIRMRNNVNVGLR